MDDLSRRSLRELLTLARERLGRSAAGLKTRGELIAALRQTQGGDGVPASTGALPGASSSRAAPSPERAEALGSGVTLAPAEAARAPVVAATARDSTGASPAPSLRPASERGARAGDPPTVVTRDFFVARH